MASLKVIFVLAEVFYQQKLPNITLNSRKYVLNLFIFINYIPGIENIICKYKRMVSRLRRTKSVAALVKIVENVLPLTYKDKRFALKEHFIYHFFTIKKNTDVSDNLLVLDNLVFILHSS